MCLILGCFMNKREYIQANKGWLEAKSKENGVKALPKGIYYKVLSEGRSAEGRLQGKNQSSATHRQYGVSLRRTTRVRPSTANSSTAAVAVYRWLADSVT